MRIGLLSICAMMFMLSGTDCFAEAPTKQMGEDGYVQDIAKNWGKSSESEQIKGSVKPVRRDVRGFEYGRSYADVVKGVKRQDEDVQKNSDSEISKDFVAESEGYNKQKVDENVQKNSDSEISKDFVAERRRYFEGYNKQKVDENVQENSASKIPGTFVAEKKQFFDGNNDKRAESDKIEYDRRRSFSEEELGELKNKKVVRENRDRFELKKEEKVDGAVEETKSDLIQNKSENEQTTEKKQNKVVPSQTSRSKKAYKARRARQRASKDEFSKKWKSANKGSNYKRK